MSDLSFWLLFFPAVLALNLSPGPDLIYILSTTLAHGKKVGVGSVMGVCTGALFHVAAASLGLSAILASSALAFSIIKFIGVAYLLYLGYQSFHSAENRLTVSTRKNTPKTPWTAFKQGLLIDILNPKVAIFFMAFLPQFVRDESRYGSVPLQLLYLGLIIVAMAMIVELLCLLIASTLFQRLQANQSMGVIMDRFLGTMFVALGIKLALTSIS